MEYETLYNKLLERGYKPQKIDTNSQFIIDIADILSGGDDALKIANELLKKQQKELNEKQKEYRYEKEKLNIAHIHMEDKMREIEAEINRLKPIAECETKEARDKLRLFNAFTSKVKSEGLNTYEHTAYIKSLGVILSAGDAETEEEE